MYAPPRVKKFRVLGIDPGLNVTGYGAIDFAGNKPSIVEAGTIRTDTSADLADRIMQIHEDLADIIAELAPDLVAIEKLYAHYRHPRTAILMGHARGIVLLACRRARVAVLDVGATNVKKSITGNGHASKLQVQRSIQSIFHLEELPTPPDVADALAIAFCAGRRTRTNLERKRRKPR